MRLDLLMHRERFDDVFIKTLSGYLKQNFNWNGKIQWKKFTLLTSLDRKFIVNDKLNVIYHTDLKREKLSALTAEFAYHPKFIRNLLQNLYVEFATTTLFERFTSSAIISIDDYPKEIENWCIIPGNHSVRIIDLDKDICIVILKDGFNKNFIVNEINIRRQYPYLPIPKIIESDVDLLWYIEERIIALPWNRISSDTIKKESLLDTQMYMSKLYKDSYKSIECSQYLHGLTKSLNNAIDKLPTVFLEDDKNKIVSIYNKLLNIIQEKNIDTVLSHGDFQPANIMIDTDDNNKIFIIDWEYSKQKFFLYDALVFASEARMTIGLSHRLRELNENKIDWAYNSLDIEKVPLTFWMISLFLVEDLIVRLEELQIPKLKHKSESLEQFFLEIEQMDWLFNE